MATTPDTLRILSEKYPERFCRATRRRGRYVWVCYQRPGHDGPHSAGNSANDPIYMKWFTALKGGRRDE